ncbi:MAG TPA: hypothetical protein VD768_07015 [Sphingomicrobium sp.]|nr:hypothetical protein [Sphingomicrobium sp.]
MADEALWKKRFGIFMLVRMFGLMIFLLGVVIFFTDLLRPGGWKALGSVLIIVGMIDSVFSPKLLKKHWESVDREQGRIPPR